MTVNPFVKTLTVLTMFCALTSCQAPNATPNKVKLDERASDITPFPSVYDSFACIPAKSAHIAAHRGTDKQSELPENALESLQALQQNGVLFAEVDVARLKDGTYILFHDGVWDERSSGKGPISATNWPYASSLLLKDSSSKLTTINPSKFEDVLAWAKKRIYLEIDFKSSTNPKIVIDMIRAADMMDQVILISYNAKQAIDLHALAPTAMISVSIFKPGDIRALQARGLPTKNMAAWLGKGDVDQGVIRQLRAKKIPILLASFYKIDQQYAQTKNSNLYQEFADPADLIVSDTAISAQQSLDYNGDFKSAYQKCITANLSP